MVRLEQGRVQPNTKPNVISRSIMDTESLFPPAAKRDCCGIQAKLESALHNAETCAHHACEKGKEHIRAFPVESVALAAATGFLWPRLPVGAMLVTGARILAAFAPPALLALGACALADKLRRKDEEWRRRQPVPPPVSPLTPSAVDG